MPFVDAIEQALLDHVFTDAAFTPTTTIHVALSTTTPTDAGTNVTEPVGNAYARQPVTAAIMAAAAGTAPAAKSNGTAITFPQATGSWGTVTHWVLYSTLAGATPYAWAALTTSKTIGNGDTASFAIGALVLQLGKGTPL